MKLYLILFGLVFSFNLFAQPCNTTITTVPSPASICNGNSVVLTANASGATGYTWAPSTGLSSTNAAVVTATPSTTTTYTVTATGCGGNPSATIVVTILPAPNASFTHNPASPCGSVPINFNNTSTGGGLTYSWNFGDPGSGANNISTSTNPTHTFSSATGGGTQNFTVTLTATGANGCQDVFTQVITVSEIPSATIGGTGATIYNGLPYFKVCTSSATSFLFTNTSSTTATNTNYVINWGDASPNFTAATWVTTNHTYAVGQYTITYTVTGANGCTNVATYYVFIGTNPSVGLVIPGSTNICAPITLTFPITNTSGNSAGTNYIVTFNDGSAPINFVQPPPSSISHTFSINSCGVTSTDGTTSFPNSFSASITASNPCGTSAGAIVPIYVSTIPTASLLVSPNPICVGSSSCMTNTSSGGEDIVNGNCVNVFPCVWFISPATGWSLSSGTLGNTNGHNGDVSLWLNAGSTNICVNFLQAGSYTIKLITGGQCGVDSTTSIVNVSPIPTTPNAGTGFSICDNASSFNLNSLNPTPVGGTWSGVGVTGNSFSPATLNGVQIITYSVGAASCLDSDTIHITVNPLPNVTVNSPAICIGSSTILNANGATTYSWTPSTGLSATIGSSVTSNPVVTTTYTVTGINSLTGCSNSATSIVTVNPLPIVNAGSDQNFCNANTLISLNGTPVGGTWSGTGVTGNNFNPGTAGIGNWTLTYSYTNSNGCSNSDQVLMTVINPTQANAGTGFNICIDADSTNLNLLNPTPPGGTWSGFGVSGNLFFPPQTIGYNVLTYSYSTGLCATFDTIHATVKPLPVITVNISSSICIGDSVTLNAGGAFTYLWSPSIGLNNNTDATVIASPTLTITYTVTGSTVYGCTSENFSFVSVIDLGKPISGTEVIVCESGEATISAIPAVNGNSILWYTDSIGGTSLFEGLSYTSFFNSSIVFYTSTYNNLTGCESQERLPVLVSVYPLPQIEINFTDASYGNNGAINATVTNGHPPYTYDWSNDGTGDFDDSSFISGLTEGNYSLTVSDQKGCTNNIDVAIANGEEILIPTGISPNGDGLNDTWEIPGSYQYDDLIVSIFNLQGQLLYYQNKNYIPWNGKYQGELVPVGDYYFVIESLSHKRKQTGTLTVKY